MSDHLINATEQNEHWRRSVRLEGWREDREQIGLVGFKAVPNMVYIHRYLHIDRNIYICIYNAPSKCFRSVRKRQTC